jgi:hypothetical protein
VSNNSSKTSAMVSSSRSSFDEIVAVVSVLVLQSGSARQPCFRRSPLAVRLPQLSLSSTRSLHFSRLFVSPHLIPLISYPVSSAVPLIYCERPGPSGVRPQTRHPVITLVRVARLPGPTRRALSGMLIVARSSVWTRVN